MTKRQLTEKEKSIYEKQLKAKEEELTMWDLTVEVLKSEIEDLPKKVELSLYAKNKELNKSKLEKEMIEMSINTLKSHLKDGVDEKEQVEYSETEVEN